MHYSTLSNAIHLIYTASCTHHPPISTLVFF
uniref:Uncharacterized protein n=1 Tax=Ciona intestinalis TaxID=7719 RepID=H2XVB6_CIOIN